MIEHKLSEPSHVIIAGEKFLLEPIVFAGGLPICSCCEEPWCDKHEAHYADCDCVGPDSEDYDKMDIDGTLYALVPVAPDEDDLTLRA